MKTDRNAAGFHFKIPTVESFSPLKMLLSESGDIVFKGDHLETGSMATVTLHADTRDVVCEVGEKRSK